MSRVSEEESGTMQHREAGRGQSMYGTAGHGKGLDFHSKGDEKSLKGCKQEVMVSIL